MLSLCVTVRMEMQGLGTDECYVLRPGWDCLLIARTVRMLMLMMLMLMLMPMMCIAESRS